MQRETINLPDDDQLTDDELEVVIGGLPRPWRGTWDAAELGRTHAPTPTGAGPVEAPPATPADLALR
jgi:hypothetical protein